MSVIQLARGLKLPLEVGTEAITVLGLRGSGKTNTGGVLVEELLKSGQPVLILDPLDVWWGLCSSIDGKHPGYQVLVFGGPHGQLPLEETSGKTIAQFVVEERVPVVLSMRHLRKAAQRRLVTELAEELYHLKGQTQYRQPLTVVIDEAPLYVPQTKTNDMLPCVGAIEDLIARGRSSGFGVVMISQRSATLNKDVMTQSGIILSHRLTSPQDKKALREWLEDNAPAEKLAEILSSLAELKNGEAWVWAPAYDVFGKYQVRLRETFDSSATPKAGAKRIQPKNIAQVDLESLKGKMTEAVEKAKASDPKLLQQKIKELEKKLAAPAKVVPTEVVKEKRVEVPILKPADVLRLEQAAAKLLKGYDDLQSKQGQLIAAVETIKQLARAMGNPQKSQNAIVMQQPAATRTVVPQKSQNATVVRQPVATDNGEASVSGGEEKILQTIIQLGRTAREELTVITGYKKSSRDTYIQRLGAKGFVATLPGGLVEATEEGKAHLPDVGPLPTGGELVAFWTPKLAAGELKILQILLANPDGVTNDQLSELTDYKKSSRDTYIQRMGGKRLCYREGGLIKPNKQLLE